MTTPVTKLSGKESNTYKNVKKNARKKVKPTHTRTSKKNARPSYKNAYETIRKTRKTTLQAHIILLYKNAHKNIEDAKETCKTIPQKHREDKDTEPKRKSNVAPVAKGSFTSVPVIPSSDLLMVEEVRKFNTEALNGFLKGRLNDIDNHINTLTAQKVKGVDFLGLKYEMIAVKL
ncbi:hypothetical protein C2G38_2166616 [Gigaspora rosea]|uniref:Uncharacterized protein n=1 Tax=Gigaspora rosea TaxID=44941 RepID=A0A397VTR6_9GLOM|nr:hypothetical protein C2G38_2166616 [Gigaspora rosea]